ncbi:MAG: glycogen synthase GlgA [Peptococcaceae bacterium]|nr:glycogen synthase GlgA [Peptococcaceae bacterium]MDH7525674.1 glycogen synthase GlgA [Peptococcaceae bacterium]
MKVLFAAAEGAPFAKSGGLGDVIGSLPRALQAKKVEARVIMPLYGNVPAAYRRKMKELGALTVPVSWRKQYCGINALHFEGITWYFLDNEYYFKREGLYGYGDDAERFAFFSRAVLESLPFIGFRPSVLHCHDWHTGLVSVYLRAFYSRQPFYSSLKTVFTIHNIAYQGVFPAWMLGDVVGLKDDYYHAEGLRFFDCINYLQGGIIFSDRLTTVSKTYAEEIMTPAYGENMDNVLRKRKDKLCGIINGIDGGSYNPRTDPHIYCNYRCSLRKKGQNKMRLQQELNLPVRERIPMLAVVSRLAEHKGINLLLALLPDLLKKEIQLVVLGTGDEAVERHLSAAAGMYPARMAVRNSFDESLARRIYAGSDMLLMPSRTEPCGLSQLIALRYGTIPVVRETGGLKDTVRPYNEVTGEGNGFCFGEYSADALRDAVEKALEVYKRREVWAGIVKNAVQADHSWDRSAGEYVKLYRELADW